MGWKDLFFEKVDDNTTECSSVPLEDDLFTSNEEVNMEGVSVDTLIPDIYKNNGMEDVSRSIFKVEEACSSLPETMAEATKKSSVSSLLGIFGLTVAEVIEDGQKRIALISRALDDITSEATANIAMMESEVEEHKKAIESLERNIAEAKANEKHSNELVREEAERIAGLVKFIGGE